MLVIRREQMRSIQEVRVSKYVETLARHLELEYAAEIAARDLSGKVLREVVREAVNDAYEYGVNDASDVELYVECVAILGPRFDRDPTQPWFGEILRRPALTGSAKMDAISERLLFGAGGPR